MVCIPKSLEREQGVSDDKNMQFYHDRTIYPSTYIIHYYIASAFILASVANVISMILPYLALFYYFQSHLPMNFIIHMKVLRVWCSVSDKGDDTTASDGGQNRRVIL